MADIYVNGVRLTPEQVAWLLSHADGSLDLGSLYPISDEILRAVYDALPVSDE